MELAERRRSRKSQSYKLISDSDYGHNSDSVEHMDTDSEPLDTSENETWLGEDGMEIKKQITGMMRLLSDKAGRVYQRVGREGETLKEEPQEEALSWNLSQKPSPEELEHAGNSVSHSQYDTRSKTQKMLDQSKSRDSALPHAPASMMTESSCCMCNCKSTLQAILLELRTMRKLMQTQRGPSDKQRPVSSTSPTYRKRSRKRRAGQRIIALTPPTKTPTPIQTPMVVESFEKICHEKKEEVKKERAVPSPPSTPVSNPPPSAHYSLNRDQNCTEVQLEVQLAEEYEVFIPKAQLDSILLNYTRSGSLLFRKLVCAFFDDATLANSLPNGKRKRGLNDQRKGLDQNIVGAIKVFTEKYCTANRIEKLPGPRDWVQILQDQIKLARRRLKRAETTTDGDEIRTCTYETGADCQVAVQNA
ncbi:BEN domain-containing protein 7 isoform X1 [Hemibagrus wyckioides]|uniref:BEN domain-containing protein 7 isoform X1 n=1 Tax=Hemibagrus wyckioides TaxID=337641 RepID=UPI00266D895D|nr:BEN domain-containing protein 7 isoform X1 [Hemibagrus wyckioides]